MPSRPRPSRDPLRLEAESLRRRLARREKERERDRARVEQLIEELNVYREETRQQTEQLIAAQHAIEESRDRYANLYDFAPIGYLTLDHFGSIEEINLVAAQMLGIDRTHGRRSP